MICGKQPFKHPDMKVLYSKITKGEFEFPDFVSEGFIFIFVFIFISLLYNRLIDFSLILI